MQLFYSLTDVSRKDPTEILSCSSFSGSAQYGVGVRGSFTLWSTGEPSQGSTNANPFTIKQLSPCFLTLKFNILSRLNALPVRKSIDAVCFRFSGLKNMLFWQCFTMLVGHISENAGLLSSQTPLLSNQDGCTIA